MNVSEIEDVRDFANKLLEYGKQVGATHMTIDMANVGDLVREHSDRARKYVALACLRAAQDRDYLRSAAVVAAAHDNEFLLGDDDDGLLKSVLKRGDELGTYRELLEWICRNFSPFNG